VVGRHQSFLDECEEAALAAVLSLHGSLPGRAITYHYPHYTPPSGQGGFATVSLYTADGHVAQEWGVNISAQGFRDWLVDQFDRAINNLGWEACFLDVSQAPPQAARERFDWQGKPAGQELG